MKSEKAAKCRNYKFKAKTLRNDLVLHHSSFKNNPTTLLKKIASIVNEREEQWTKEQQLLLKKNIEKKIEKAMQQSQYVHKLLVTVKTWRGPAESTEELLSFIRKQPDLDEKIVKNELKYYKHTHKAEVIASPELFKTNNVSHKERLTNLCILLDGQSTSYTALPKNTDALRVLQNLELPARGDHEEIMNVGDMCVTLWIEKGGRNWYLGYCVKVCGNGLYEVEHIHRAAKDSNLMWKYPTTDDIATVDVDQILDCEIDGEWNITANRNNEFTLKNHGVISKKFKEVKVL